MNDPKQFDALVDIVARRMTDGEARPMRARVMLAMARLEGLSRTKSRGRSPRPMFWAMGAVAATACAAMVFVGAQLTPEAPVAPAVLGTRHSAVAGFNREVLSVPPRVPEPREQESSAERRVPSAEGAPSPDQLAWQADAVPVLEPLALLTLQNIQPEQLEVRPLTMAPLDVPLIGAEDE